METRCGKRDFFLESKVCLPFSLDCDVKFVLHLVFVTWSDVKEAYVKEDALESLYEKRARKRSLTAVNDNTVQHEVKFVGLPLKTLDGQLCLNTVKAQSKFADNEDETMGENEDLGRDNGIVKLTKAEKRAKITKQRFSGMFLVTSFSDPKMAMLAANLGLGRQRQWYTF